MQPIVDRHCSYLVSALIVTYFIYLVAFLVSQEPIVLDLLGPAAHTPKGMDLPRPAPGILFGLKWFTNELLLFPLIMCSIPRAYL